MAVAAIDQGTTSTRVLVSDAGGVSVRRSVTHDQRYPHGGWVEHDPEQLLANVRTCLEAAGPVDAIGIDNQGESCLAWDALTGRPVTPVIVWQDNRTGAEIERLKAAGGEALTLERAGLPLDPYFSASKLAWILRNVPEAVRLRREGRLRLGTTDAFFLDRLAGEFVTDITTASRTSLMNLSSGTWDPELCRLFDVPPELLPVIRPTVGEFGTVCIDGREVPVTASVVDQQAALYGHGCRTPGDAKITFGTGAFALALSGGEPLRSPLGLLPTVAWQHGGDPPMYALDGGVYNAGSAIEWLRGVGLLRDYAELDRFEGPSAIERGLAFVPALSGLACPHWDRRAGGLWIGLSLDTRREDLLRAVLEGIALRTAEVVGAMRTEVALSDTLSIDGGLSRSRYFVRFLADVLGRRVEVRDLPELTALGCAALAAVALGERLEPTVGVEAVDPNGGAAAGLIERFAAAVSRAKRWY